MLMGVGAKIERERRKRKWTLKRMAKETFLDANIISKIEREKIPITPTVSLLLKETMDLEIQPCDKKRKEVKKLEKYIFYLFKGHKVAVDDDDNLITIVVKYNDKFARTVISMSRIKFANEETLKNEALAIGYEIANMLEREGGKQ